MADVPDCLVMAKPAGPRCNMRCTYCYYVGTSDSDPKRGRMQEELLERYIAGRLAASPGPETHFEWHGGEPTLLGLDYFKAIARIERRLCPARRTITNGIQTNGLLLNGAWAEFLRHEGFSVGLSLDGPAESHNAFRRTADGKPTHERVLRAFTTLMEHGVFTNVLCVLHEANAGLPDEVYGFFRKIGVTRLQFLPLVTPASGGAANPAAASPETVGDFFCRVFDLWIEADVGRLVIQTFDEALRPLYGIPHSLCIHRETCGDVAVLESDGGFYACDHFVDLDHLIGNVKDSDIATLAGDPRMKAFGLSKRDSLPRACRECDVLAFCNGGCPKDRIVPSPDGDGRLDYLCRAWKKFFIHCRPELERLAFHLKEGKEQKSFHVENA
jgi:uncharacterized protein